MTLASRTAQEIFDREFLEIRAKLLQLAAHFDRIDRAGTLDDAHRETVAQALQLLLDPATGPRRAEQLQLLFSRMYEPNWRVSMDVSPRA